MMDCGFIVINTDVGGSWNMNLVFRMVVSINGGTPTYMVYNGKSMKISLKWMLWGYPYVSKPPYFGNNGPNWRAQNFQRYVGIPPASDSL